MPHQSNSAGQPLGWPKSQWKLANRSRGRSIPITYHRPCNQASNNRASPWPWPYLSLLPVTCHSLPLLPLFSPGINKPILNRYRWNETNREVISTIVIDGSRRSIPSDKLLTLLFTHPTVQGELQDRDVPLHDHLLARGWFQTGVAASNRGRDHQVRQVRGRRSPGRRDRIREVINSLTEQWIMDPWPSWNSYSLGNYNPWNSGEEVGFLAEGFPNLPNAASVTAVPFHPCPSFPSLPPIRVEKSLFAPSVGSIRRRTNQRFSPVIYTDKIYGREC